MIYSPGRFLFFHMPRSGGMSITSALAKLSPNIPMLIATGNQPYPYTRHIRPIEIRHLIRDWDTIYKWSVLRPLNDVIESDYNLCLNEDPRYIYDYEWRCKVQLAQSDYRLWRDIHWNNTDLTERSWSGPDIDTVPFNKLTELWPTLCERMDLGLAPSLPRVNCSRQRASSTV